MRVPLSWLKEKITLNESPQEIAKILTSLGLEVEGIEKEDLPFENVVVARVVSVDRHPNADRLVVAKVDDGSEVFQVVCGAPNCREGMLTAFARPFAYLSSYGEKKWQIKPTKLRGVESFGMLCAEDELGLGDNAEGILEILEDLPLGTDLRDIFSDTIFEIGLTPNLGHASSIEGVARELFAIVGSGKNSKDVSSKECVSSDKDVHIDLPKNALSFYGYLSIEDVKITPSPIWMQRRLFACGINPKNLAVDIGHYVMLEMGTPLHMFDRDKLSFPLSIRLSKEGEEMLCLDGQKRGFPKDTIVIADKNGPQALAGVMGGEDSATTQETNNLFVECAAFSPQFIRRAARGLNLLTDAAKIFERGVDPEMCKAALDRTEELFKEISTLKNVEKGVVFYEKKEQKKVICRLARAEEILGLHLSVDEVETIFKRLEMKVHWDGKAAFHVQIPSYRLDISKEIDLIEEIARIWGYDRIPRRLSIPSYSEIPQNTRYLFEEKLKDLLVGEGLQEFITTDLSSPHLQKMVGKNIFGFEQVHVLNPTSEEQSVLRTSLIPGLVGSVIHNFNHYEYDISAFELGKVHFFHEKQYKEMVSLSIVLSGAFTPPDWRKDKGEEADFFLLKGILERISLLCTSEEIEFKRSSYPFLHPGRQAEIYFSGNKAGVIGELHPSFSAKLPKKAPIYIAELSVDALLAHGKEDYHRMEALNMYPGSERDWTVTVLPTASLEEVLHAIKGASSPYLEKVEFVSLFKQENKKNLTFRFFYRDKKKTIEQETVDLEHARVLETALEKITPFKGG